MRKDNASTVIERGTRLHRRERRMLDQDPTPELATLFDRQIDRAVDSALRDGDLDEADRAHADPWYISDIVLDVDAR